MGGWNQADQDEPARDWEQTKVYCSQSMNYHPKRKKGREEKMSSKYESYIQLKNLFYLKFIMW